MNINSSKDKINFKENKNNKSNNSNNPGSPGNPSGISTKPNNNFNNNFKKKRNKKRRSLNSAVNANPENKNAVQQPQIQTQTDKINKPAAQTQANLNSNANSNLNKNIKPYKIYQEFKKNNNKDNIKNTAKKDVKDLKNINENNNDNIKAGRDYQTEDAEEISINSMNSIESLNANILEKLEKAETGPTIEIVGIRFKPVGKIYFFSPNNIEYSANEKIIVETSRGLELGYIAIPNKKISAGKVVQPLKQVIRKASEDDIERSEKNKIMAKETVKTANERIKFHNLDNMKMKLIEAEYTFDNSKLIYYFTADGRVDFRDLVKDLAAIFKTRIEMRQIGIRDQTKILGGLATCGRPFCCNSFLQDFAQVTIKMAKEQNKQINSAKISGACGRLMCCLKYEQEAYEYLSKDTPKINSIVEASTGETGVVTESNILTGVCKVRINNKSNSDGDNSVKPFPKKNLKIIGFMKNEHEHLYNDEKESDAEIEAEPEESGEINGIEQDI